MKLTEFDYILPENLIAQRPAENREDSRLLVLDKKTGETEIFDKFNYIIDYLNKDDLLIINETKVIPARFNGYKKGSGGKIEIFLVKEISENTWEIMVKPGKRAKAGSVYEMDEGAECEIISTLENGGKIAQFNSKGDFKKYINSLGKVPLPPYITRESDDNDKLRYQTVYAKKEGAVAAPTAGLHFTEELFNRLKEKGVKIEKVVLHVGIGTFRPVKAEIIFDHKMHTEYYEISQKTVDEVNKTKINGNKVIAVGTTSIRAIESATIDFGKIEKRKNSETDIFIYPGYEFKIIDGLITNFHLPKSSLLMLVSALSSLEYIKNAYNKAINSSFRFFSYGDAMLIK